MKLTIDSKIFEKFPGVMVGVVVAEGLDNRGDDPAIGEMLRGLEDNVRAEFGSQPIVENRAISPWREAYRVFGAKPSDYPSSIENLIRRVVKGEQVRHINKLVDLYNIVSLKYLLPVGGEDLDAVKGDIYLTFAGESEAPVKLLGEPEARSPKSGEVIYKDDVGTLCRRWNWKEAERTKLTENTKRAIFVLEALPQKKRETLEQALEELKNLVVKYCNGIVTTTIES